MRSKHIYMSLAFAYQNDKWLHCDLYLTGLSGLLCTMFCNIWGLQSIIYRQYTECRCTHISHHGPVRNCCYYLSLTGLSLLHLPLYLCHNLYSIHGFPMQKEVHMLFSVTFACIKYIIWCVSICFCERHKGRQLTSVHISKHCVWHIL